MHVFRSPRVASLATLALLLLPNSLVAAPQGDPTAPGFTPVLVSSNLIRISDDTLVAEGVHWRARFRRDGARIEVAHPSAVGELATANLRLCDYGRAGFVRQAAASAPSQQADSRLSYRHPGIVERYRVDAGGFEQSFVLHQRPAGHGDFVIGITASGDGLQVPRLAAAHQALEFRHGGQPTVRYGEAIAFSRSNAANPIEVATRSDGQGRIELIVPGAFLDRASYPVIVDPSVGPVFLPGDSILQDAQPDVAQDPRTGHFAFVWQRTFPTGSEIRARLYDRFGNPRTGVVAVSTTDDCSNPSIGSFDLHPFTSFWVVFESGDRLRYQRLNPVDLGTFGSPGLFASAPAGARDGNPSVCGDGWGSMIVVYDRTPPGANAPTQIMVKTAYIVNPSVTNFAAQPIVLHSVTSGHVRRPRIARGLTEQLVGPGPLPETWRPNRIVWERFYDTPAPGDYDIWTAAVRVRSSSIVVTSPPAPIIGASVVGPNETSPDIAMVANGLYDGDPQFLVAWEDEGDVRGRRYDLAGPVAAAFDIRATANLETTPAVGGGACEFSVGYLESTPGNEFSVNVRAARVLMDGTVAAADRAVDVLNGPSQFGLRASSLPPSRFERVNTVFFAWTGQTGGQFGLNDVRARRFDPVAANVSPFGSACSGPNGELPEIGTSGEPLPGNHQLELTVSNAPPNSLAVLLIGDVLATNPLLGAPGCSLYLGLPILNLLPTVTDASGLGAVPMPLPCGFEPGGVLAFQWGVLTPGHNAAGWITSDDLDVSWTQ